MLHRLENSEVAINGSFSLTPANAWLPTVPDSEDSEATHLYSTEKQFGWWMNEFSRSVKAAAKECMVTINWAQDWVLLNSPKDSSGLDPIHFNTTSP